MDLNQFILALRARRKAFVIAFVATIATAIAVALILPKKYVASATLLVDMRDEQTMTPGRMTTRERASYVQTQIDLLKSHRVATQVARELKLAQKPGMREAWEKDTGGVGSIDEWIGANLQRNIVIDSSSSAFLVVNYSSDDPKYAADVANAFTKAYLDTVLYLRTEPTREAAEWFNTQLKTLRAQVVDAQTRLNTFQKQKGILAEDARVDVESARLTELNTQLMAARNATYDATSRYKQASEIVESGVSPEAIPDVLSNTHVITLKTTLGAVEARLAQESTVLGENHPQFLRTAAEVQGLRDRLQAEMKKVVAALSNQVEQHRRRERELQAALEAQNQRLLNVKDYRIDMTAMTREIENAQRSYDTVLARYTTARIDATANKANVMLLAPAVAPLKPLHPKVGLIAGLSVVLGALLAAALVYVFELLDRRVRSRADLEARLAVPSLGRLSKWQPSGGRLLPAPSFAGGKPARALPHPW